MESHLKTAGWGKTYGLKSLFSMVADALIAALDPSEVGNKQRKRVSNG